MFDNEKLIELVKNHPILYDVSHEDYKNIRKKDTIWDEIGSEFKESGDETKKKWRNLRNTYSKFLKLTKTRTGKTSKKKWIWAKHMTVFRPYLAFAAASLKVSPIVGNADSAERDEECKSVTALAEIEGSAPTTSHKPFNGASLANCSYTTVHPENCREHRSASSSSIGELIKYFENKKKKVEYDAIDSLFLAHAKTLRTFSKNGQIITKMKISQMMMEQELLEEANTTNFSYIQANDSISIIDEQTLS